MVKSLLVVLAGIILAGGIYFFYPINPQINQIEVPNQAKTEEKSSASQELIATATTPEKIKEKTKVTSPTNLEEAIRKCFPLSDFEKCLQVFIKTYLDTKTTLEVLAELDQIQQKDVGIRNSCHPIVHVIGRETFRLKGNIPEAFAACDQTCHSGCYHGAMEFLLRGDTIYQKPGEERAHINEEEVKGKIANVCSENQPVNLRFQCLHGLGHAIVYFLDYNLFKSLDYCDLLSSPWDESSCYGGAFMENITAIDKSNRFLAAKDYHFPCRVVEEKYKSDCYVMQTSRMFEMGLSKYQIIEECKNAGDYRLKCIQSLGRDLSNDARTQSPDSVSSICELMEAPYKNSCTDGVAFALSDNTWDGKYAFPFCESFKADEDKKYCYLTSRSHLKYSLLRPDELLDNDCRKFVSESKFCI
jgi:hypothetical protein